MKHVGISRNIRATQPCSQYFVLTFMFNIFRLIVRILCEATPKEGMKLIHEHFSNRIGKPGCNVNRDRRMEFRIGVLKRLIKNLGSPIVSEKIQQMNATVDIKEQLFLLMRESRGIRIRSGKHKARTDDKDYDMLFNHLTETKAHLKVHGRIYGDFNLRENIMNDNRFDNVPFYRWLSTKNKEMRNVLNTRKA